MTAEDCHRHWYALLQVQLLGRERTPAQWKALFSDAGFRLSRIVECRGAMAVIEAAPV